MAVSPDSPEQIERMTETLHELCRNRDSSQTAIKLVGATLYRSLFAPFRKQIEASEDLQFDLDPALRQMPVAALVQSDASFVGISHAVVILPAWWSARPSSNTPVPAHPRTLLVEGAPSILTGAGGTATLPGEYLETSGLAKLYLGRL